MMWRIWIACVILAGCAPVDHWAALDANWDRQLAGESRRLLDTPPHVQPIADETVSLPEVTEETIELSVEQAVLLALRQNRDLAVRQLQPVIVGAFERIERGRFDPEVFASATYREEEATEVARATASQFSVVGQDAGAEVGIRQRLPTGTDLEASVSQDRSISTRSPEQQTARLGLTVTQALLRGFGPAVNLASIRQAQLGTLASRYELRGFVEALLAQTEIAYWRYTLAQREIAIFESSLRVAQRQRDEIEQRIEVGVLAQTEAAAARAEVALHEQALIDARAALEAQRLRLLRLVNPAQDDSLDIRVVAGSDPRLDPQPILDLPDRLAVAQRLRPDLNEAKLRLEQDRLETIVTRNGLLPRLDLFINLGKTGYADTFPDSFRNIDGETYDLTAGLRLSHALGNRAAEGRHTAALATRQQAAAAVANLRQLIRLDVQLAVNEVERARQQLHATAATRALQEETLHAERERFNVGVSTSLLVAQAQRDLLASQIAEVEAVVNYRVALVNLYLAEGSILERRGVSLAQTDPGP